MSSIDKAGAFKLGDRMVKRLGYGAMVRRQAELLAARAAKIVDQKPDISDASISASVDAVKV